MRTLKSTALLFLILSLTWPAPATAFFSSDVGIDEEAEMGREFDKEVRAKLPVIEDPLIIEYCEGVVQRLVKTMPPQPFRAKTTVIRNGTMNAFAVPGGYIYMFTGLIIGLESEAQLAAVLAHELAHVSQHHVVDRMKEMESWNIGAFIGTLAGMVLTATGGGSSTKNLGQAITMGSQAGAVAAFLEYTRDNEIEADHVGMNYLVAAGYNPGAMPQTFETMAKQRWTTSTSKMPSYMRTHPHLSERVAYLKTRVQEMAPELTERKQDNTEFHQVQSLIRGRFQDAKVATAYYEDKDPATFTSMDYMGMGMAYQRLKKGVQAANAFDRALAAGQDNFLLLREAGRFFFKQGDFDHAEPLLKRAMIMAPKDAITLFYNARLLGERGRHQEALSAMDRVLSQVPKDSEVHYYMGRLLGESGDLFGAHLHLAYAAVYDRDLKQAKFHRDKAMGLARTEANKARMTELDELLTSRDD